MQTPYKVSGNNESTFPGYFYFIFDHLYYVSSFPVPTILQETKIIQLENKYRLYCEKGIP